MFEQLRLLLPSGRAFATVVGARIRQYLEGLGEGFDDAVAFVDAVFEDAFPSATRELGEWERQFAIPQATLEADRRANVAAEWAATGGQSPAYLESVLQDAGFDVYVHEWWATTNPYTPRDPRTYATPTRVGTVQCASLSDTPHVCGERFSAPECNRFATGDPTYLVNKTLRQEAPPPIPNDPTRWPFFLYVAAQTFPNVANVDGSRRDEFERLLLKHCPTQQWIVLLVDYVTGGVFDDSFDSSFE